MSRSLSLLLHAPAKVGKSTLSSTAPPPILVFDAEGGWRFIRTAGYQSSTKLRQIEWNPVTERPPRYDGTWDVCRVNVMEWRTLTAGYDWLTQSKMHDFKSVIFDSVTEGQRKLKANLRGLDAMRIQDWGDLLTHMDRLIRSMRDLTLLPKPNPIEFVMFIAETEMKDDAWRPAMQGQIGRSLPYWVDICGYLYSEAIKDTQGAPTGEIQRRMIIGQGVLPRVITGERIQGALPPVVSNPHITKMLEKIFDEQISSPVIPAQQEVKTK